MVGVSAGGLAPHSTSTWEGGARGIIHGDAFYVAATGNIFSFYRKKTAKLRMMLTGWRLESYR